MTPTPDPLDDERLILAVDQILFANGEDTSGVLSATKRLSEALGRSIGVATIWGEIRLIEDGRVLLAGTAVPWAVNMRRVTAALRLVDQPPGSPEARRAWQRELREIAALPAYDIWLFALHPDLRLHIGEGDRWVNLVREGVDCVVRVGEPTDSGMIVRKLGEIREATAASAAYLARNGVPLTPDDLDGHVMIGFLSSRTGNVLPLEFTINGEPREISLPARLTVTGADTSAALDCLGFGIIQAPRYRLDSDFASGALVEVLADYPPTTTPISVLYPHSRQLSSRVRVFIDWLAEIITAAGKSL